MYKSFSDAMLSDDIVVLPRIVNCIVNVLLAAVIVQVFVGNVAFCVVVPLISETFEPHE